MKNMETDRSIEATAGDRADANSQTRAAWNEIAEFWDSYMGDQGNDFQRNLVGQPTERLLEIKPGEFILDVACGSGIFSRRMAELGANVVAFDFCENFLAHAKDRSGAFSDRIQFLNLDATDTTALLGLGEGRFDAAVCTMALMDMADIDPLASALPRLLKPGGRFVFSVCHPCFNSAQTTMYVERDDRDGELVTETGIKVTRYCTPYTFRGIGIIGQPTAHLYFHRPLELLLKPFFHAGFVLDAIEEPSFEAREPRSLMSWENRPDIPPALVARLRLISK